MSSATRLFLVVGLSLMLILAVAVGAATAAIYRAGSITVDVRADEGTELSVSVPAGLANMAIALAPLEPLANIADELEPWTSDLRPLWPVVRSTYRELERAPDFALVEVSGTDHRVSVRKEGARLVIDVTSDEQHVHVVVPLSTLRRALTKLERALSDA